MTPTKTRTPAEELAGLEEQRRRAVEALEAATRRMGEISARRQDLAVAVVAEDPAAVAENETLEEELRREERRLSAARKARAQLERAIHEAGESLAEAERRGHLERASELARERYALEERAEEEVGRLLVKLSELERVDNLQRRELSAGGQEPPREPVAWAVEAWLLTRLAAWLRENPAHQDYAQRTLPDLDALAEHGEGGGGR